MAPTERGHRAVAAAGSGVAAVEVEGLTVQYSNAPAPALDSVTLSVPLGARDALVGANGAGKSTLLKAVVGLVPIQAGTIRVYGEVAGRDRARVAYLPQIGELDWRFPVDVRRLVLTGRYVHLGWLRRPGRRDRELADTAIERLGLGPLAGRQIGQLSGGQRQRALLARALAQGADVLLLDEPFNAVDAESRAIVVQALDDLRARGATVIVATHDIDRMDLDPDQVHCLSDGRVVAAWGAGTTGERPGEPPGRGADEAARAAIHWPPTPAPRPSSGP